MLYEREISEIVWQVLNCKIVADELAKWQSELASLQEQESELASLLYELVNKSSLCSKLASTDRADLIKTRQQLIQVRRHDIPVCQAVISRLS